MTVYLDNAASTAVDKEVLDAMLPYLSTHHGNPSSVHRYGRETREVIERSRRTIADILQASPWEIFFTSGATEANNLALTGSIQSFSVRHAITTKLEHKSVLNCLQHHAKRGRIRLNFVDVDEQGRIDYEHLERLLRLYPHSLVSLMHGNNEIGTLNDLTRITELGKRYHAFIHADTVQTLSLYPYRLGQQKLDFVVGSAHKFHGPKGVGFLYANKRMKLEPLAHGGSQEKNLRAGTENVSGIVGLAKALEIAHRDQTRNYNHLVKLKQHFIRGIWQHIPEARINGDASALAGQLPSIVNVCLPRLQNGQSLVEKLDEMGIAVSAGSACNESFYGNSHVLKELKADFSREHVRFSFSKHNTVEDVYWVLKKLTDLYANKPRNARPVIRDEDEFSIGKSPDPGYYVRRSISRESFPDMIFD